MPFPLIGYIGFAMNKWLTTAQVLERLKREIKTFGSQVDWADANNVHPPQVSDVLAERRPPTKQILEALGLRKVAAYEER